VLKAVSEEGVRLNIRKATLRHWRSEFARHLRLLGVAANATERSVRGESRKSTKDGIYRATLRGVSTHTRAQAESVAAALILSKTVAETGKSKLVETRRRVEKGWQGVSDILSLQGMNDLAAEVRRFVSAMPQVRTEREWIAASIANDIRQLKIDRAPE
jgi:hypothetical protein